MLVGNGNTVYIIEGYVDIDFARVFANQNTLCKTLLINLGPNGLAVAVLVRLCWSDAFQRAGTLVLKRELCQVAGINNTEMLLKYYFLTGPAYLGYHLHFSGPEVNVGNFGSNFDLETFCRIFGNDNNFYRFFTDSVDVNS